MKHIVAPDFNPENRWNGIYSNKICHTSYIQLYNILFGDENEYKKNNVYKCI
jgi:hypothetical protein